MYLKKKRNIISISLIALLLTVCLGLSIVNCFNAINVHSADLSVFTFITTSDTECSVRLNNKAVAAPLVIPERAMIDGKEYVVTSVAANGFSSAVNVPKVRLPKTVQKIGNAAFANCKKMTSITMAAVKSIGTNAFNVCTSLEYLIIPETVESVAATILRGTNTQVYVRASESKVQELGWVTTWNGSNANQSVVYESQFKPEIEYKPIYDVSRNGNTKNDARLIETPAGYMVDSAQPFIEEWENGDYTVYIPAYYEGLPVVGIENGAFSYNTIKTLTIGYAETPINIDSYAFNGIDGDSITINRNITLNGYDDFGNECTSTALFADSSVSKIVLPNNIDALGSYMFQYCTNLSDVHFLAPNANLTREEEESYTNGLVSTKTIDVPSTITTIGDEVFSGISKVERLNIPNSITVVGANILVDWKRIPNEQHDPVINVDFVQESDLPWDEELGIGWNPLWKQGCEPEIIFFQGSYLVSYQINGGTHFGNPTSYRPIDEFVLNDAERLGYTFDGWYENREFSGERVSKISRGSSGNKEFHAKWIANDYTIVYDANCPLTASNDVVGATSASGHVYDLVGFLTTNGFSIEGWKFAGWNTAVDGSGTNFSNGQPVLNLTIANDSVLTLYAKWEAITYDITYITNKPQNASGLLHGSMENSKHTYENSSQLQTNAYSLELWNFIGWNTKADGSGDSYLDGQHVINLTSLEGVTVSLYAQWKPSTYTVAYNSNKPINASGIMGGLVNDSSFYFDDLSVIAGNEYVLTGWKFEEWNTKADGSGTAYSEYSEVRNLTNLLNNTVTLYAQWSPISYSVKFVMEKPTYASSEPQGVMDSKSYFYDETFALPSNLFTLKGWTFMLWKDKEALNSFVDGQIVSNLASTDGEIVTLYTQWTQGKYRINYNANMPYVASGPMAGETKNSDHSYDISSTLNTNNYKLTGWSFMGWSRQMTGDVVFNDGQSILNLTEIDADVITLYARWVANPYTIEFLSNQPINATALVKGMMSPMYMRYDLLKPISYNDFRLTGWTFRGWSLDGVNVNFADKHTVKNLTVKENEVVKLYAVWQENTYTIEYLMNKPSGATGGGSVSSTVHTYDTAGKIAGYGYYLNNYFQNGWNTKADGSGIRYENNESVLNLTTTNGATIYLFAQWKVAYKVEFNGDAGYDGYGNNGFIYPFENFTSSYSYGAVIGMPFVCQRGYVFQWAEYINGSRTGRVYPIDTQSCYTVTSNVAFIAEKREKTLNESYDGYFYLIYTANQFKQLAQQPNGGAGRSYSVERDLIIDEWTPIPEFKGDLGSVNETDSYGYSTVTIKKINFGASAAAMGGFANIIPYTGYGKGLCNIIFKFEQSITVPSSVKYAGLVVGQVQADVWILDVTAYGDISHYSGTTCNGVYGIGEGAVLQRLNHIGQNNVISSGGGGCVTTGTLITLADGRQVPVEKLTGREQVLVWNFRTGTYDVAPIMFIDNDPVQYYEVVKLHFSDGTVVNVIGEHAFWSFDLNKFVYMRQDAQQYIGQWFNKQNDIQEGWKKVRLDSVSIEVVHTQAWSPVTFAHLNYYVNGMLSMPGATEGLVNIFEVNAETMKYDESAYHADIELYGLFTYEEFAAQLPVSETVFEAFGGQHLKVSMGKGLLNWNKLYALFNSYADYLN